VEAPVLINQNFVKGWRTNLSGVAVYSWGNKPAMRLPQGVYESVEFFYRPESFNPGLILTLLGLAGALVLLGREWRKRKKEKVK
jgi:hypothetical protein